MRNFLCILLLAMMVCCWSCSGGNEDAPTSTPTTKPEEKPKIEVTTTAPVVTQEGGTASVTFTSNTDWKIDVTEGRAVSWCTVSPTSGGKGTNTLTITTSVNESYDERNAKVTIKAGTTTQSFTVTQKQKDALIVTSNKVEINAEGGNFSIEAQANVDITYEIEESAKEWISANESRGLLTKTLNFMAKANENTERRQGKIILKGGDGLTETVTVYQEGEKPTLVITSDDIVVGSDGESIKIELKSNVDYIMVMPEVGWLSKEESRALSAYTHYLLVASNDTYDQRSAKVFFQNEIEGLKDSISITQLQKDAIIVAKNEYTIASEGGDLDFSVNTNVDFEVSISVDWIKQNTKSRALVEKSLNFSVMENGEEESREGEIVFTYQDLKQIIKVKQKGAIDYEAIERAALIEFYKVTGGDTWLDKTNWCSDKPLNEWYGISTDVNGNGRVIEIRLASNGEKGDIAEIVRAITPLTELKVLYLCPNNTDIYGRFPNEIYNFTNLEQLYIDSQLEGEITNDIVKLSKLKGLSVRGVAVNTSVFKDMCEALTNLNALYFHNCKVEGQIPEEIGNLKQLNIINLITSKIEGSLPESIWNLPLITLNLQGNPDLGGTISSNIKNLKELRMLHLGNCSFSGSIPMEICECINLEDLWLSDNKFEGSIPNNIGNLKQLHILELQNNNLTGNIPASISQLSNLVVCSLFGNRLSGRVPKEVSDMWSIWVPLNKIVPQQEGYQLTYDDIYSSSDYSKDGEIIQLQEHTEGNGIPVILLGDAFVDTDMGTGGLYETTMKRAMEAYFSIEPMTSLRPLFDVYLVKCVSENNFIGGKTALSCKHSAEGEGAGGDADMSKCLEYASKVIDDLADVQIKVIMNDKQQIGYCAFLEDNCTISFNSLYDQGLDWQNFEAVFRHEAIGHGFGLLADEYADHVRTITEEEKEALRYAQQVWGRNLNVDVTNDSGQVLWSKFLSDERYANEDLGIYEGGWASFSHGVYRPSYNSIMRYNEPIFNAPSREAIYKRAMKLAYGDSWTYDYEEFVKFDEKSRNANARSVIKPLTEAERKEYIRNHRSPILIKGTWRDAIKGKGKIVVPFR